MSLGGIILGLMLIIGVLNVAARAQVAKDEPKVDPQVRQTMVQFLRGEDVSKVKIALPPLKFQSLP